MSVTMSIKNFFHLRTEDESQLQIYCPTSCWHHRSTAHDNHLFLDAFLSKCFKDFDNLFYRGSVNRVDSDEIFVWNKLLVHPSDTNDYLLLVGDIFTFAIHDRVYVGIKNVGRNFFQHTKAKGFDHFILYPGGHVLFCLYPLKHFWVFFCTQQQLVDIRVYFSTVLFIPTSMIRLRLPCKVSYVIQNLNSHLLINLSLSSINCCHVNDIPIGFRWCNNISSYSFFMDIRLLMSWEVRLLLLFVFLFCAKSFFPITVTTFYKRVGMRWHGS